MKRKGISRLFQAALGLMLICAFAALPYSGIPGMDITASAYEEAEESILEFETKRIEMPVGQQLTMPLRVSKDYASRLIFKSSKPDVISIDKKGRVTALQTGFATITAKVSNSIYTRCLVKAIIPGERIIMNKTQMTLDVGKSFRLKGKVSPDNASYWALSWSSDAPEIATVEKGVVTAHSKGTAVIKAQTKDGTSGYCEVKVTVPVKQVAIRNRSVTVTEGSTYRMKASVLPDNADDKTLKWSTGDPDVAVVDENGKITAVGSGSVLITAKSGNGISDSVTVNVIGKVTSVRLPSGITAGVGETVTLNPTILPANADKTLLWSSSDQSVASVSAGTVRAKKIGKAVITAQSLNGIKATCTVTVKNAPDSVSLQPSQFALGVGERFSLKTALPSQTASYQRVFTSDDPSVCTVSSKGVLVGKKTGVANITLKLFNGVTATSRVSVKAAPTTLTLDQYEYELALGETAILYNHVISGEASRTRFFASDDPGIVSIDSEGKMKAVSEGTTTVSAFTYNNVSASCKVTVLKLPDRIDFSSSSYTVPVDGAISISPVFPEGTSTVNLQYTSDNKSVCTVDEKGNVRGVREGQATITVSTANNLKKSVTVYVKKAPSSIQLLIKNHAVRPDESFVLPYRIAPGEMTNKLSFTSNNPDVCTVDSNGTVTANQFGAAVITVSTHNGKKDTCRVVVTSDRSTLESDPLNRLPLYENITPISQYPSLPTGCEITALATVLNYYGYNVSKENLSDNYLEKGNAWETDFREKFAGEPRSEYSYGCYAPVIEKAANKYLTEKKSLLKAIELKGYSFDELFEFTDRGIPVMVWTTIDLAQGYYTATWTATNNKTVTWYANEHCMVLVGRIGNTVYTADPTRGNIASYDKDLFEKRYKELFSQAVVIM